MDGREFSPVFYRSSSPLAPLPRFNLVNTTWHISSSSGLVQFLFRCYFIPLLVVDNLNAGLFFVCLPMRPNANGVAHPPVEILEGVAVLFVVLLYVVAPVLLRRDVRQLRSDLINVEQLLFLTPLRLSVSPLVHLAICTCVRA